MMIAALVAFIFFLWMPAEGTFCDFGRTPTGWEVHYLQHFRALRAGQFQAFNFAEAEGLITFPSFHVVWALLIFMAVRQHRILRWLFAVVEAAVIVSAITAGGHYLVDLFAGALLTAAVCWITAEKQSDYPPDIQEKIASNSSR
jgi:membrane-associated phospholipid phosphatase